MSVRFHYNSNGYFPDRIDTERLTLERVSTEKFSAEEVFEVMSSQGVEEAFETYPYETPDNIEEAQEYVEKREYENREDENSMYFVKLDDSEDPFIGLEAIKNEGEGVAEIGFWISSDYWGNGYSPEALEAMLELLLDEKDFEKVEVQTRKSNQKA
ncbi:MAG: GNAT family N-acetyltransferase, partial [Candidatus Nanohaloarchaea archaeon]